MNCTECGKPMNEKLLNEYQYTECGLDDVTLVGVTERFCPEGHQEVVIPRMKELHRVIAKNLAAKDSLLTGQEARFLRKYLGCSQADLAKRISVSSETVCRWETEASELSWRNELLLRMSVLMDLRNHNYGAKAFDAVAKDRHPAHVRITAHQRDWVPSSTGMLSEAAA